MALVVYWCPKCNRKVCEALPKADVWCACGRKAKPLEVEEPPSPAKRGRREERERATPEQNQIELPL